MVADQMYESEKIDKYYLDAAKICPYKKNHFQIEEFAVEKENMNGYENTVQHDCKYVEKKKDSKIDVKLVASRRRRDENKKSNYILAFGRNFSYNIRNWGRRTNT
jgi:CRISPR/Cas system-associated endonuclease Cas3-HD